MEEFDSLDPLARDAGLLVGSSLSPDRSPYLSSRDDDGRMDITPPTSPELVVSDDEMDVNQT